MRRCPILGKCGKWWTIITWKWNVKSDLSKKCQNGVWSQEKVESDVWSLHESNMCSPISGKNEKSWSSISGEKYKKFKSDLIGKWLRKMMSEVRKAEHDVRSQLEIGRCSHVFLLWSVHDGVILLVACLHARSLNFSTFCLAQCGLLTHISRDYCQVVNGHLLGNRSVRGRLECDFSHLGRLVMHPWCTASRHRTLR